MNLTDGYLIYPKLTVSEFVEESSSWTAGLYAVVCDNATQANTDLSDILTEYNVLLGRSLSVYNYDSDEIVYYRIEPEVFSFYFDRIHREQWRRHAVLYGKNAYPSTNTSSFLNMSHLLSKHLIDSSCGVGFLTLPSSITSVDKMASQIAYNYTYPSGNPNDDNYKNREMKRTSSTYYVYNQEDNSFYRFS